MYIPRKTDEWKNEIIDSFDQQMKNKKKDRKTVIDKIAALNATIETSRERMLDDEIGPSEFRKIKGETNLEIVSSGA